MLKILSTNSFLSMYRNPLQKIFFQALFPRTGLLLFFVLLKANLLLAGWIVTETTSDPYGNKKYHTTFIEGNLIRFEQDLSITILDLNHDSILMIFPGSKVYWQGTADELKKEIKHTLLKKMERFMAEIPEDDQPFYENYFKELKKRLTSLDSTKRTASIFLRPTNKTDSLNGFNTTLYEVYLDSVLTEKIWFTKEINPFKDTDLQALMKTTAKMNPFAKEVIIKNSDQYLQLIKNGLVIKTEKLINGQVINTTTVEQVNQGKLPAAFFKPPKLYKKVSIPDVMALSENSMLPELKTPFEKDEDNPFGGIK